MLAIVAVSAMVHVSVAPAASGRSVARMLVPEPSQAGPAVPSGMVTAAPVIVMPVPKSGVSDRL